MNAAALAPRLLTLEQAAAYLSLPLATTRKLGIGRVCLGGKTRYDRQRLDLWLNEQQGITSPPTDHETPEAARAHWKQYRHAAGRS